VSPKFYLVVEAEGGNLRAGPFPDTRAMRNVLATWESYAGCGEGRVPEKLVAWMREQLREHGFTKDEPPVIGADFGGGDDHAMIAVLRRTETGIDLVHLGRADAPIPAGTFQVGDRIEFRAGRASET
jgi:hypothetical protein